MSRFSQIQMVLDPDKTGRVFDELLHRSGAAQDIGDLKIVTNDKGTEAGRAVAILAFTAVINGKPQLVQTVTTVRTLQMALGALNGRYPETQ